MLRQYPGGTDTGMKELSQIGCFIGLHEFHWLNIIIVLLYNNEAFIGTWEANIIMFLM